MVIVFPYGRCAVCDGGLPRPRQESRPRVICDEPECRLAAARYGSAIGIRRRARIYAERYGDRTTYTCSLCGVEKPLTLEHFTVDKRNPDGTVARWARWCRPCKRGQWKAYRQRHADRVRQHYREASAMRADRMKSDPEYAERVRAVQRQAAAKRRRLKADVVREQNAAYRRRRRARGDTVAAPADAPVVWSKRDSLAGAPLVAALAAYAHREEVALGEVAERIGMSDRAFRRWETGERASLTAADAALIEMGLCWWDVWDPERWGPLGMTPLQWVDAVDAASWAFDGERLI
jgi:hypothetical protein